MATSRGDKGSDGPKAGRGPAPGRQSRPFPRDVLIAVLSAFLGAFGTWLVYLVTLPNPHAKIQTKVVQEPGDDCHFFTEVWWVPASAKDKVPSIRSIVAKGAFCKDSHQRLDKHAQVR